MKIYEVPTADASRYYTRKTDAISMYNMLVMDDEYVGVIRVHNPVELIESLVRKNDEIRNKLIAAIQLLSDDEAEAFKKWLETN